MVGDFMFFLLLSPSSCVGGILSFRCAVVLLLLFFVAVARCLYKCVSFLVSLLSSLLLLICFYLAARGRVRYPRHVFFSSFFLFFFQVLKTVSSSSSSAVLPAAKTVSSTISPSSLLLLLLLLLLAFSQLRSFDRPTKITDPKNKRHLLPSHPAHLDFPPSLPPYPCMHSSSTYPSKA